MDKLYSQSPEFEPAVDIYHKVEAEINVERVLSEVFRKDAVSPDNNRKNLKEFCEWIDNVSNKRSPVLKEDDIEHVKDYVVHKVTGIAGYSHPQRDFHVKHTDTPIISAEDNLRSNLNNLLLYVKQMQSNGVDFSYEKLAERYKDLNDSIVKKTNSQ